MVGRRGWRVIQKSVAVALALILMSSGPRAAIALSIATSGQLTETPTPQAIQTLRRVLDQYQPQIKILSPKSGELLQDNTVSLVLQVKDLPIYQAAGLGLGPHLHVVIDDQMYRSVYDAKQPIVLSDLSPGTHTVRVFAVRPWDESFKNDGSFAQTTFNVFTKTDDNDPDSRKPLLTYSQPQGNYGAEPILLDFYLTNAPLHFIAQDHPEDSTRDWKIKATVNGQSFLLDRWQPIYLKGVKPGKNWVQLEFIDENGTRVENFGNNTARIFTYTPNGTDTLSKLTRGELTIAQSKGIVDPTYTSPVKAIEPATIPSIEPKAEPKTEPKVPSQVLPKAVTPVKPEIAPKVERKTEPKIERKIEPQPLPLAPVKTKPSGFKLPIVPIPLPMFGRKSDPAPKAVLTVPEESKFDPAKPDSEKLIDLPRKTGQSDRRLLQSPEVEKPPAISKRNKPFQFFNRKEKPIEPIAPIDAPRPSVPKPATLRQPLATMTKKVVKPDVPTPESVKPKAVKPEAVISKAAVKAVTKPNVFFPPLTKPEPPTPQPKPAEPKSESQTIAPPPTLPSRFFPGQKVEVTRPAKVEPKAKLKIKPKTEPKIKVRVEPETESSVKSKSVPSSIAAPQLTPRVIQEALPIAKPEVKPAIETTTPEPKAETLEELVDRLNKTIAKPVTKPIVIPSTEPQVTSDFTPQPKPNAQPKVTPTIKPDVKAEVTLGLKPDVKPTVKSDLKPLVRANR